MLLKEFPRIPIYRLSLGILVNLLKYCIITPMSPLYHLVKQSLLSSNKSIQQAECSLLTTLLAISPLSFDMDLFPLALPISSSDKYFTNSE